MNNENGASPNKGENIVIKVRNSSLWVSLIFIVVLAAATVIFMLLFFTARGNRNHMPAIPGGVYFHGAIATQLTEASRLVTLEIEMEHMVTTDNEARWGVFRISQDITFYATGTFSTDLSLLTGEDIIIDDRRERVIVFLPRPQVEAITIDPDRTVFQDPEGRLLRFRDITVTHEEQNTIQTEVFSSFMQVMESHTDDAYRHTKSAVSNLLGAILESMGIGEYDFEITWQPL